MSGIEALDAHRRKEDEYLVVRCQLGERAAFDELIERWQGPLWRFVRRLVGDEDTARDVTQDVWLRALRGIATLRDGSRLRAWLFGIARRTLMDRLREQYARPAQAEVDISEVALEPATDLRESELEALELELAQLPMTEREVLTLFYLQELSLVDVADVIGVPIGTVKSRLFRARHMLRHQMEARGELL